MGHPFIEHSITIKSTPAKMLKELAKLLAQNKSTGRFVKSFSLANNHLYFSEIPVGPALVDEAKSGFL